MSRPGWTRRHLLVQEPAGHRTCPGGVVVRRWFCDHRRMAHKPEHISAALKHLGSADPVMRVLIERVGRFKVTLDRDRFRMLVHSIISQQISGKAAISIRKRLAALAGPGGMTAERLGTLSEGDLRSAGLSPQKTKYIQDLSQKVLAGEVRLQR